MYSYVHIRTLSIHLCAYLDLHSIQLSCSKSKHNFDCLCNLQVTIDQTEMLLNDSRSAEEMEGDKQLEPKFLALKIRLSSMVPEGKTNIVFLTPTSSTSFSKIYPPTGCPNKFWTIFQKS